MYDLKIFDAEAAAKRLPFVGLVNALERGFAIGAEVPVRHHHAMPRSGERDATLLLMPAWSRPEDAEQYLGVKIVTVVPGNTARNLPGLFSTYVLYDALTGQQLALIDGNTITARRTVATSALAARCLSRPDSTKLLVIGSGRIGSLLPYAYRAVRPIAEVAVWDVHRDGAQRLVGALRDAGFRASLVSDLETAVRGADIVSAATLASEPLVKGQWLKPGTHLDLIGGFTPTMREADDEAVRMSAVYVDTMEALHEAGDLVQPLNAEVIDRKHIVGSLAQLCLHEAEGRHSNDQVTYFKAVGSGLADLVAARMVYTAAGDSCAQV